MKKILTYLSEHRFTLFILQAAISGFCFGVLVWNLVSLIKDKVLQSTNLQVRPWAFIFFNPYDSNLINYILLCAAFGFLSLFIYGAGNKEKLALIKEKTSRVNIGLVSSLFLLSLACLAFFSSFAVFYRVVLSAVLLPIPLIYLVSDVDNRGGILLSAYPWLLLIILSIEPIRFFFGPVYLMNEYDNLSSETILNGQTINNASYLKSLSPLDIDTVKMFYDLKNQIEGKSTDALARDDIDFLDQLRFRNMDPIQSYLILNHSVNERDFAGEKETEEGSVTRQDYLKNLPTINVESIKKFYLYNWWEYAHLNMSRGQMNHIGQILNPLNAYEAGMPIKDIYMQYGLGNTFILKWTMDLFGGVTIENIYKCHIYYIVYFSLFLLMLIYLFQDRLYVASVYSILAISYFFCKYIGVTLGVGIIPTIHFFDVIVIILLLLFFRKKNVSYLLLALLSALLGVIINRQFGIILSLSLTISIIVYIIENKTGRSKKFWFFGVVLSLVALGCLSNLATAGTQGAVFNYFLFGLFSWPANSVVIALTIGYLVISYSFLFINRNNTDYLKYIFIFVFFYTQGLLVYYYWSGLSNHLPMSMPFMGLQIFLMFFISEQKFSLNRSDHKLFLLKIGVIAVLFIAMLFNVNQFYKDKKMFTDDFVNHKVYHWKFDRAHLISTMNPEPFAESIQLMQKYSAGSPSIYVISEFDNVLPFLGKKYGALPFDLAWHLLSDSEIDATINKINRNSPEYLFVDGNIDQEISDPWSKIYNGTWMKNERVSRIGRYQGLQKIFKSVSPRYVLREKGKLLAVYQRNR